MVRRISSAIIAVAMLVVGGLAGSVAHAATTSNVGGNALRISPVRNDLTIQPGASQTIDVYVQNLTSASASLQGVVNDFTASKDESGNPSILLNGQEAPSHSLKQFVAPIGTFTLGANAQKDVKVTISIPKGTAGGGYYGVVRFEPANSNANNTVNLSASVGTLVLVRVPGNITENVSLASFDVRTYNSKTFQYGTPGTFFANGKSLVAFMRFNNQGNIQEEPFGKVVLRKNGRQIATYEINNAQPRGNVLPDSIRRFTVPLAGVGAIGRYTIQGNFGYGSSGRLLMASKTFYIVPVAAIAVIVAVLVLVAFASFALPRLVRNYNRHVVRRAAGPTKR